MKNNKYNIRIKYVVIFLCLLLFSFTGFEIINRQLMQRNNFALVKLKNLESQKHLFETLIIGNSHFITINPDKFIQKTFKFSIGGANYYQVYYFLKKNISTMSNLKTIIINADPLNWSSFDNHHNLNPLLWNRSIDYNELSKIVGNGSLKHKFYFTLLNKAHGRRYFLKKIKKILIDMFTDNNDKNNSKVLKESIQSNNDIDPLRRVKKHFNNQIVFDRSKLLYFEKILQLCENYKISVITIQMPHRRDYIEVANDFISTNAILENVLNNPKYKNKILKNIDYYSMFINNDHYFGNGDHVNDIGGKIISNHLSKEINSLLFDINLNRKFISKSN